MAVRLADKKSADLLRTEKISASAQSGWRIADQTAMARPLPAPMPECARWLRGAVA